MGLRDALLAGLKPALIETVATGIAKGDLKQPVNFAEVSKNVWHRVRMNPQTAGALIVFKIKREDIDSLLRQVFEELKIEVV